MQTARAGVTCALRCVEEKKDLLLVEKNGVSKRVMACYAMGPAAVE